MKQHKVLDSMTQFAFKLYDALCNSIEQEDNIFFSPASIYAALAMTYCGARGSTADEIMSVMGIPGAVQMEFHEAFSKIWNNIYKAHHTDRCKLNMCNRIWLQKDIPLENHFSTALVKYYDAHPGHIDFSTDPKSAAETINKWVAESTNNLIKNVVDENQCSDTRLCIVNTIYFKGEWLHPFRTEDTKPATFFIDSKTSCNVEMMYQKKSFGYANDKDFNCQVLIMRYNNASLRMIFVLPNEKFGLADLEKQLKTEGIEEDIFDNWVSENNRQVEAYIPRFQLLPQKVNLKRPLQELGITKLFDVKHCDLKGMSCEDLYVSSIAHQTFVDVNEEGVEACAATTSSIKRSGISVPPTFRADHPFLFMIIDSDTSCVLFWGRFCKPT